MKELNTGYAFQRFLFDRVIEHEKNKPKPKPPCPWRPTSVESMVGGMCHKCGYPARIHKREDQDGRKRRRG